MTPRRATTARPTRGRLRIREVRDPRDPAIRGAYALLSRTFDRGERVDLAGWTGSLRERASGLLTDLLWHLLVAEHGTQVVGFASGNYVGSLNIGVIGYLAVESDIRSHGLGSRLRERLKGAFQRDALRIAGDPLEAIVGEVSTTNPWLRALAARPGVVVLDFAYVQPRLRADDQPTPFRFYYEALVRPRRSLPAGELRRILFAIWRRIYRVARPLDRRSFRRMLRSLERRRTIGGIRLAASPSQ